MPTSLQSLTSNPHAIKLEISVIGKMRAIKPSDPNPYYSTGEIAKMCGASEHAILRACGATKNPAMKACFAKTKKGFIFSSPSAISKIPKAMIVS